MNTQQIVLASRPKSSLSVENFRFEEIELSEVKDGEVLLKGLYYSVDPYMRGRMNDAQSYVPPYQINLPIEGGAVSEVLKSKSGNYKEGDLVAGMLPWRIQNVVPVKELQKIDTSIAPASYYLGILGMPGLTAYFGMMDIGKPKKGETVVVSGAAGAVGIVAGQIAKAHGCRVIGIAGSDEKTKLLKDKYAFDEAINYKTTSDLNKDIAQLCPDSVDIYFDNVGGKVSDAVIRNMNFNSRVSLCGQIALYNGSEMPVGPRLEPLFISRSILMQGFIVGNYRKRFPEGIRHLTQWINEGKLKFSETIVNGFNLLPSALLGLFKGENTGKMIVKA